MIKYIIISLGGIMDLNAFRTSTQKPLVLTPEQQAIIGYFTED